MKKFTLLVPILLATLFLSACGDSKSTTDSSSSSNNSSSSSVKSNSSTNSTSSSSQSNSSNSTSDINSSSSSSDHAKKASVNDLTSSKSSSSKTKESKVDTKDTNKNTNSNNNRLNDLNSSLKDKLGNIKLPQNDGLKTPTNNLNIRYVGDKSNFQIFYSVGNSAAEFNDTSLTQQNAYAVFEKQSFNSKDNASSQINYLSADTIKGLPSIDLGSKITGYKDNGAGNTHLMWNEGRWSMSVHGVSINNQDPVPMAKQAVSLLNSYSLPVPKNIGQLSFDVTIDQGSRNQIITWQDGSNVYSIKTNQPDTAIKMAASIK